MESDNRWAHVTADDRSGALYIVTFLGFTYTSITFLVRLLIKWNMLGADDLAMLLAEVRLSPIRTSFLTPIACQYLPVHTLPDLTLSRAIEIVWDPQRCTVLADGQGKIALSCI